MDVADAANATMVKFGWPDTLIAEYRHWVLLLRPAAPTLGSVVLAAKGEFTAYGALPPAAFAEQARVVTDIEAMLRAAVAPARINYLMLMMVDRHVHFHVIPRYDGSRAFAGVSYPDAGWPKLPDLATAVALEQDAIMAQRAWLRDALGSSRTDQ